MNGGSLTMTGVSVRNNQARRLPSVLLLPPRRVLEIT
jgi:hypothetical protein